MAPNQQARKLGAKTTSEVLLGADVLTAHLDVLKSAITAWGERWSLWDMASFQVPFKFRNQAPSEGEATLLCFDGDLMRVFNSDHEHFDRLEVEFRALLDAHGYEHDVETLTSVSIYHKDDAIKSEFLKLHRWQWIQDLADRRLYDLHTEVFEHFKDRPEAMHNLTPRQYEEFLDSVFRNQGFHTELGPGSHDGGVDIRLYQSESIPELVALVQAKRYKSNPITREPVAALSAIAQLERAPKALFVTSSRFLPSAREFAENTQERVDMPTMELADLQRTQEWCTDIATQLDTYFQTGDCAPPPIVTSARPTALTGKVVRASWGFNMTINAFAVIEADFPHEVILRPIGSNAVSGDGQVGTEVPNLGSQPAGLDRGRVVAFKEKSEHSAEPYFWGNGKHYSLWDGKPVRFNSCD